MIADVAKFHREITREEMPSTPTLVSPDLCLRRFRFLIEEAEEFYNAAVAGDIVGAADGLADVVYVALGTAYVMGLPFEKIWDAVQRANMKKISGPTKRSPNDAVKPPGWQAPEAEIAQIIGAALEK
jgi:predicted HAD superfamily Cof-like phosphohydrolase